MMMNALKMIADKNCALRRGQLHDIEHGQLRIEREEDRRDDGEILCHVVGDRERGQRAARHQQLFADLDHLDQLGRVGIEVDHVAGFTCRLRAGLHADTHIRLGKRRRIVGTVAAHGDQPALRLLAADIAQLVLGGCLGDEIVNPGFRSNCRCRHRIVTGDHHGLDAHAAQRVEAVPHIRLYDVLEVDHAKDAIAFDQAERGAAGSCDLVDSRAKRRRLGNILAGLLACKLENRIDCALAQFTFANIDTRTGAWLPKTR